MADTGITNTIADTVATLAGFDPDVAERDELAHMLGLANEVLGFTQHLQVRINRRLRELHAEGRSESPNSAMLDEGRRSGKEARAIAERDRVCHEFPGLEDALAAGAVSTDHLDALARLTKRLTDAERSDLAAVGDDIAAAATSQWVSEFERSARARIDEIRAHHRPDDDTADLDRRRQASRMSRWTDQASGMHKTLIELDPIRDATLHHAIEAQLARLRQDPATAEQPFAQLQIDALIAAVTGPAGERVPEVIAHIDAATLCHGRHPDTLCETTAGDPLPVDTVRRLCCDAVVVAAHIDEHGQPLAVGREHRTATRAQRRALRAMYRTCAHPHCAVTFDHCRIHHIVFWRLLGTTDLDNLIPLCDTHHHLVHEGGWHLAMAPDRTTTWTRPDGQVWWSGNSINRIHDRSPAPPDSTPPPEHHQPQLC